jgi:hypothetical protein
MIGIGYVQEVIDALTDMKKDLMHDGKQSLSGKVGVIIEAFSTQNLWSLPEDTIEYYIQSKAENISVGSIETTPMVVEFCGDGDIIKKPTVIAVVGCNDESGESIADKLNINEEWKYILICAEKDGVDWNLSTTALLIGGNNKDTLEMFGDVENNAFWNGTTQAYSEALSASTERLNYCHNTIGVLIEGELSIPSNITIMINEKEKTYKIPSVFTKGLTLKKEYINAERKKMSITSNTSATMKIGNR